MSLCVKLLGWLTSILNKTALVTSLPLNAYMSMHHSPFQRFGEGAALLEKPTSNPPRTDETNSKMVIGQAVFQEWVEKNPDIYTSKHTRKQDNPIRYTQSKDRSPRRCCRSCVHSFKCSTCWTFSFSFNESNSCGKIWGRKKRTERDMLRMRSLFSDSCFSVALTKTLASGCPCHFLFFFLNITWMHPLQIYFACSPQTM